MARLTREKRPKRDIKKIYLLAVEGETEKRYFELMPFPSTIQIIVRTGRHSDPHSLIDQVDKLVEEQKKNGRLRSGDPAWIISR